MASFEVLTSREVHEGKVFSVAVEEIRLPNGRVLTRDVVRHPGAVAMVPLLNDGRVILVKQFRHAAGGYLWEIPAGTLEPGEDPRQCAQREIEEETGYRAGRLDKIGEFFTAPGICTELMHLFEARDLVKTQQHLDEDEIMQVGIFTLRDARQMIHSGEIRDAKTIVGLLLAHE